MASVSAAVPTISPVTIEQDQATRYVKVTYKLTGAPGIVTADFLTNGVSIGQSNIKLLSGDVNRLIQPDADAVRVIKWPARKSWPDHEVDPGAFSVKLTAWTEDAPPDFMTADLLVASNVNYYVSKEALPYDIANDIYKTTKIIMRRCPAAGVVWRMGSPTTEKGRFDNETLHEVTFSKDYWIGVYLLTQRQYQLLTETRPSYFNNNGNYMTRPVERVSYDMMRGTTLGAAWPAADQSLEVAHQVDSGSYLFLLRAKTGVQFDLPTEAQWEYACRAGESAALFYGKELTQSEVDNGNASGMSDYGWYWPDTLPLENNTRSTETGGTLPVGRRLPNNWDIYDTIGNVWELCLDWRVDFTADPATDPRGGATGQYRVCRGTSWSNKCRFGRSAYRHASSSGATDSNNTGFRLAAPVGGY